MDSGTHIAGYLRVLDQPADAGEVVRANDRTRMPRIAARAARQVGSRFHPIEQGLSHVISTQ
jgi:hypothetical protein